MARLFQTQHLLAPLVLILLGMTVCESTVCKHLLPGLNRLRRGIDISKLDLLPLDNNGEDGFKQDVLDYHCDQGKTRHIGDTEYTVPDEVSSVIRVPRANLQVDVKVMKTASDIMASKSASVEVGVGSSWGSFSASASYKKMTNDIKSGESNIEQATSSQSVGTVNLVPSFALKLGKYAQMYVDKYLPKKYSDNPGRYERFIKMYGTHYFEHAKLGGSMQLYMETKKSFFKQASDREIAAQAKAEFDAVFVSGSASVSGSMQDKKAHEDFMSNTKKLVRSYGGNTDLMTAGGMKSWLASVAKKPWLYAGKLTPIYELIRDNDKMKAMKQATLQYTDKPYLDTLIENLNMMYHKYSSSKSILVPYIREGRALRGAKLIDHEKVLAFAKKISKLEAPSWFNNKVSLCFKWRPVGSSNQCGGRGVGRKLCAKPGHMTRYYKDNSYVKNAGCRMQWGIMRPGLPEAVLDNVKMCFKWRRGNYYGRDQCNHGSGNGHGEFCAPVNKFTKVYTDSTNIKQKAGCYLFWKLSVPKDSPIWLLNMKLCFEWKHPKGWKKGKGQQCFTKKPESCALANSWTQYYYDETDKNDRSSGCQMRWGLRT